MLATFFCAFLLGSEFHLPCSIFFILHTGRENNEISEAFRKTSWVIELLGLHNYIRKNSEVFIESFSVYFTLTSLKTNEIHPKTKYEMLKESLLIIHCKLLLLKRIWNNFKFFFTNMNFTKIIIAEIYVIS